MAPSAADLWAEFVASGSPEATRAIDATFSSWAFGDAAALADDLVERVVRGRKTATAGALWSYEYENEALPAVGDYSVVLDGSGVARCILRTIAVEVIPFDDVGAEHAALEGGDDPSLEGWRTAHWAYYERELAGYGMQAVPTMPVVCERFELVWVGRDRPPSKRIEQNAAR